MKLSKIYFSGLISCGKKGKNNGEKDKLQLNAEILWLVFFHITCHLSLFQNSDTVGAIFGSQHISKLSKYLG